jgi:formylglycine-generating enzyme required for sulfatase activity
MVRLPGGTFFMGSPGSEAEREETEGPVHEVELSPFLIAKYETSQAEWARVFEYNPSEFVGDDLPVQGVSWSECVEFCRNARLKLPTEAQWEYACRAGTTTPFAFGNTITEDQVHCSYDGESPYHDVPARAPGPLPVPVSALLPNDFGLHGMHGNAWEWCEDVYDEGFYVKPEACQKDPVSTSGSAGRVVRGGKWHLVPGACRSASRYAFGPTFITAGLGFRPAYYPLPRLP